MINVTQQCEGLNTKPLLPVSGANEAKDVLPDRRPLPVVNGVPQANADADGLKYSYRSIQNVSAVVINVAFGRTASANDFNIQLPQYASWSVYTLERVSVFSAGAWTVAVTEQVRNV